MGAPTGQAATTSSPVHFKLQFVIDMLSKSARLTQGPEWVLTWVRSGDLMTDPSSSVLAPSSDARSP